MSTPLMNLIPMNSANSFIKVEYLSVLDTPKQSNTKPFRSSHHLSNFISRGYVYVPGYCLHAVLVVG